MKKIIVFLLTALLMFSHVLLFLASIPIEYGLFQFPSKSLKPEKFF